MKFGDYYQLDQLCKNSIYGYKLLPNGYGKVFDYCAKVIAQVAYAWEVKL